MADLKKPVSTPTTPTVPAAAPKLGVPPTPPAPPAAPEPKAPKVKKERKVWQTVFPTAEEATAEANSRDKGPRRAFKTELNGEVLYVVANNEGRAGGVAFMKAGGTVEELGKTSKKKDASPDTIIAALAAMPDEQRKLIEEALAKLKK